MTQNLLLHVRGIRQMTIGRDDRATRSIQDHLAIIEAIRGSAIPSSPKSLLATTR